MTQWTLTSATATKPRKIISKPSINPASDKPTIYQARVHRSIRFPNFDEGGMEGRTVETGSIPLWIPSCTRIRKEILKASSFLRWLYTVAVTRRISSIGWSTMKGFLHATCSPHDDVASDKTERVSGIFHVCVRWWSVEMKIERIETVSLFLRGIEILGKFCWGKKLRLNNNNRGHVGWIRVAYFFFFFF